MSFEVQHNVILSRVDRNELLRTLHNTHSHSNEQIIDVICQKQTKAEENKNYRARAE